MLISVRALACHDAEFQHLVHDVKILRHGFQHREHNVKILHLELLLLKFREHISIY